MIHLAAWHSHTYQQQFYRSFLVIGKTSIPVIVWSYEPGNVTIAFQGVTESYSLWDDFASLPPASDLKLEVLSCTKDTYRTVHEFGLTTGIQLLAKVEQSGHHQYVGNEDLLLSQFTGEAHTYKLSVKVSYQGEEATLHFKVGLTIDGDILSMNEEAVTISRDWFDKTYTWKLLWKNEERLLKVVRPHWEWRDGTYEEKIVFYSSHILKRFFDRQGGTEEQRILYYSYCNPSTGDYKGLSKKVPLINQVAALDPVAGRLLNSLTSSKSVNKIVRNKLISTFLDTITDLSQIVSELKKAFLIGKGELNAVAKALPGASSTVDAEEAKRDWTKRKDALSRASGLGLDSGQYPLLLEAIVSGNIPTGVFNQPSNHGIPGQPVNREFEVWEEALQQEGWAEVIYDIAQNAAARTTYERDITPWLLFMLHSLPAYLNTHAPLSGKSWKCLPKHVSASWELEMAEPDENGTVKRRSALTPVADNETGVVTVPYVSLSVGGARTQWCYSRHYYIFRKGFTDPESGGVVIRDIEEKLNGKDDYGLMYYDLNGTTTAQGYPTFLVIFERKVSGTHVHFHRVRPCRSKDSVKTPACQLIAACYQYMAGNVPVADVITQQGDIMLLRCDGNPIANGAKVSSEIQSGVSVSFESHKFVGPLSLYRSEAKTPKNRLGFIHAPEGLSMEHPEHDHTKRLAGGWFEVRRAVSWEANPTAIWSFSID